MAETPEDVRRWFLTQVQALWPIAGGSLSLRKSPCVRAMCRLLLARLSTVPDHANVAEYWRTDADRRHGFRVLLRHICIEGFTLGTFIGRDYGTIHRDGIDVSQPRLSGHLVTRSRFTVDGTATSVSTVAPRARGQLQGSAHALMTADSPPERRYLVPV
jgi:hypothetical protein